MLHIDEGNETAPPALIITRVGLYMLYKFLYRVKIAKTHSLPAVDLAFPTVIYALLLSAALTQPNLLF